MTTYIRDRVTGKASPVDKEEEFKEMYPSGDYVYFEVDNPPPQAKPVEEPKKKVMKEEPESESESDFD